MSNAAVLWSDGGDADHRADLISEYGSASLRIVRRDASHRRTAYYVPLSQEQRIELAKALLGSGVEA